jgi:hypothetical protein
MCRDSSRSKPQNAGCGGRREMKFVLVNGRTPRSGVLLRIVLRADRRELPARSRQPQLLLRSGVLSRPLSAGPLSTQATREGLMTIIQVTNQTVPAARPARQRCDHCGGSFGLVTHRWWDSKFCKRRCKEAHIREIKLDRRTIHRWCGFLGRQAISDGTSVRMESLLGAA